MTDHTSLRRRRLLELAGGTAAVGLLAGCGGPGNEDQPQAQTEAGPEEGAGGDVQGGGSREGEEGSQRVEDWLSETDNYDGVVDRRDTNTAAVRVGAPGNGDNRAFDPAAVRISPGMTVRWEWSGDGEHNVVDSEGVFESGAPEQDPGEPFEFTFANEGTFLYYCERHEGNGMKGAIVVGEGGEGEDGSVSGSGNDTDDGSDGNDTDGEANESEGTGYDDGDS
jgi:halocyanin-like protein